MRKRSGPAAKGNFHPAGYRQSSTLLAQRLETVFAACGLGISYGVVGKRIMISGQFEVNAFLFHLVGGGIVEFDGMLDGIDAGVDTVAQALATECMARRFLLVTTSFVDNGIDLFLSESGLTPQCAVRLELIVRRGMEFDPVRSVVNLLADGLACRPRAVHGLVVPGETHLRRAENSLEIGDQTR